jgi:aspartate aminotransferase
MKLSRRVRELTPSATLQAKADAERLRREGIDVIDFGPGEPDFDTPAPIREAAKRALDQGFTHYTDTAGPRDLRAALAGRYRADFGTDYGPEEVVVGCGAKSILFLLSLAAFEPGDRVGIFAPYWVSFPDQVRLAGAEPVILPVEESDGFVPRAATLGRALRDGPLAGVILNSPCNPTGAVIPAEELARFARLAAEHGFLIISDETYELFHYGEGNSPSLARSAREIRDRLILVSSFSKSFAMTGWRVGYALGPREIVSAVVKIQSHDATHAASFAMKGALAAIQGGTEEPERMRAEYRKRRDLIVEELNKVDGIRCPAPPGAFYVFPNVTALMRRLGSRTSDDLARGLLLGAGIATVPGSAFGADGYLRLSYATSEDRIREGMRRLRRCRSLPPEGGAA